MKVSPENIFPGAKIKMGLKDLTVIKVNAKSFYATEMSFSDYSEKYNSKLPGTTFKKFCEANNIQMCKYTDEYRIDETETARKETAIANKVSKYNLGKAEKLLISQLVKYFEKNKRSLWLFQTVVGNSLIRFIEIRDKTNFFLNINNNYVFYSMETDECVKLCSVYDYNYDHVPWEKLSCYANEVEEDEKILKLA